MQRIMSELSHATPTQVLEYIEWAEDAQYAETAKAV
jgi:hypothetical protein